MNYYNGLCMRVCLKTGLRISDVLSIKTCDLAPSMSVIESKTGKVKNIELPSRLISELKNVSGPFFVFTGRDDIKKPRSRQAVWYDFKRVCGRSKYNLSCHTARKVFAVREYKKNKRLDNVMQSLNHDNPNTTLLYALADVLR